MIFTPRYATPADGLEDFLRFATAARATLDANPAWRDWLLQPEILSVEQRRGGGKWEKDWRDLGETRNSGPEARIEALRRLKQREYLRIGLLDFTGFHSLEQTVGTISDLADFCLDAVCRLSLDEVAARHGKPGTGFSIIGMGKLGAQELNYSSDVDVMFIYGEEGDLKAHFTYHEFFTRVAEAIIRAFATRTAAGGLFRIDLRLRPEGGSGPLVRSLESCENYYAALGETWERMAMIKARAVTGDQELSYEFDHLRHAFAFSPNLSAEHLEEISHIKSRIEREIVGAGNLDNHVKLGTGGIREIEFIVQALQITHGSRLPYLQKRATLPTLDALATVGLLSRTEAVALADAYAFWRMVEHRLQLVADLQTHSLPPDSAGRERIARSLGLEPAEFEAEIQKNRAAVRAVYDRTFAGATAPVPVFHLSIFQEPGAAEKNLEALRHGTSEHLIPPRTRRAFDRLWPTLEEGLRRCAAPDTALVRFSRFVEAYSGQSYLYESLATNPRALSLLILLFDCSRFYSDILVARPELFEEVARGGELDLAKSAAEHLRALEQITGNPAEEARRHRRAELLRIFLRDILRLAPLDSIQREYSLLAQACLEYGCRQVPGASELAFIAMGKFGGLELGYGSDLDCLCVGDNIEAARGLSKFMTELLPTGILFPLDFRLRPFGEGPVAMPLKAYREYYGGSAQLWEIQALIRAVPVAGNADLGLAFMRETNTLWEQRCGDPDLVPQISRMRGRIEKERGDPRHPELEFKTGAGGLIDVEFGVQAWLMKNRIREASTRNGLDLLAARLPETAAWKPGYAFLRRVESVLRRDDNSPISKVPEDTEAQIRLARHLDYNDRESFWNDYQSTRTGIRRHYLGLWQSLPAG